MSINHHSSEAPQASLWWTQQQPSSGHHQQPPTTFLNPHTTFNLNNQYEHQVEEDDENTQYDVTPDEVVVVEDDEEEKEAMFEKALTPSDVGKLNRLVIPKQHAEKYFPLDGDDSVESNKGLLLSFEDESGKCWRFRYSYWNSSQSYVLTKGWSRYVKDKRLDAGDVVLFQRHRSHPNRLFIRWRRRHPATRSTAAAHISTRTITSGGGGDGNNGNGVDYGHGGAGFGVGVPMGWTRGYYPAHPYPMHHHHPFPYQHDSLHAGGGSQGQNETTPVGNVSSSRVLRLFGVNMECQPDDENDSETLRNECSYNNNMPSNQGTSTHHFYHHHPNSYSSSSSTSNPHHHMVPQQPH